MFNLTTNVEKQREVAIQTRLSLRIERAVAISIGKEFARVGREIGKNVADGAGSEAIDIALRQHAANIESILRRAYAVAIEVFGTRAFDMAEDEKGFGQILSFKAANDPESILERLIRQYTEQHIAEHVEQITKTTRAYLQAALAGAIDQGLGQAEAGAAVADAMGETSRSRAAMIARTETHSASQAANYGVVDTFDVPIVKEWVSAMDERTRHTHRGEEEGGVDGQTRPMEGTFDVPREGGGFDQMQYPGDPAGSAGNVINCRCVATYAEAVPESVR